MPPCEVVVFDVFDTMVVRPFHGRKDHFRLLEQSSGLTGFADARITSERSSRDSICREVNIDEIYTVVPECYRSLKDREVELDVTCCRTDRECLELFNTLKAEGRRIVLATDMYHHPGTIERILTNCGYSGWEKLYVSSAERLSKNSGKLFEKILSDLGVPADSVTVIGDSEHSDGESPRKVGMNTVPWIPLRKRYSDSHPVETAAAEKHPELSTLFGTDMLLWQENPVDEDYWHSVGKRFGGPMAVNFSLMVNAKTPAETERILFFARDGYVPYTVYNELFPGDDRTAYLHTSRLISKTFRREHPARDRDEVISILTYLDEAGYSESLGIPRDVPLSERVAAIQANKDAVMEILENGRNHYIRYIRNLTGGATRVAFVDTTTKNFTSQRIIDECVPELESTGIYYAVTGKWNVRQEIYCDRRDQHLSSSYVNIAETLFAASAAPVRDFSESGEPLFPRPMSQGEKERAVYAQSIFDGELEYARFFRDLWGTETVPFTDGAAMDRWVDVLIKEERANRNDESRLGGMKWYVDTGHRRCLHTILRRTDVIKTVLWKGTSLLYKLGIKK